MFAYKRWCKIKITSKCEVIFTTERKRSFCCFFCAVQLRKFGITQKGYKKMKDNNVKSELREDVEWLEDGKCKITYVEIEPMFKTEGKKELIGKSTHTIEAEATKEELVDNYNMRMGQLEKKKIKLEAQQKIVDELGKLPFEGPEFIKFKKMMKMWADRNKKDQAETKLKGLKAEVQTMERFLKVRGESIKNAPETETKPEQ